MATSWSETRSGSHAGRGFRYQDAVTALLAVRAALKPGVVSRVVPEGIDDVSLECPDGWVHIQIKSRRESQGDYTPSVLRPAFAGLRERLLEDGDARGVLVIERTLPGWETGCERSLADVLDESATEMVAGWFAVSETETAKLLGRVQVWVITEPEREALRELVVARGRVPEAWLAHFDRLRRRVGDLADENGKRDVQSAADLTAHDAEQLLSQVDERVAPDRLDVAVRDGHVELVDFTTVVNEPQFFEGVKVVPGHLAAGLVAHRPAEVDEIRSGLATRRFSIVSAPSGAGKSALLWLAARETRHEIRWYRVRSLEPATVPGVVRLAKAESYAVTVGFVVDDVRSLAPGAFDALASELRTVDGARLLAGCRAEDLPAIAARSEAQVVRPRLDESLAEAIWLGLKKRGATESPGWRESFELASGLVLEFTHLLTRGARLAETIDVQVEQRADEGRYAEIQVLAVAATASYLGADFAVAQIQAAAALSAEVASSAIRRLIDEHLLLEHDGRVTGLHDLRSAALMRAAHAAPPPLLQQTIREVLLRARPVALQTAVQRCLQDGLTPDEEIIAALVQRLRDDPDPIAFSGALQALRVEALRRWADGLEEVLEAECVPYTDVEYVAYLAGGVNIEADLTPRHAAAARTLSQRAFPDLRLDLLEACPESLAEALSRSGPESVADLLASLAGLPSSELSLDGAALRVPISAGWELTAIRRTLSAAGTVDAELAREMAKRAGGEAALVARLESEQPWTRNARLQQRSDGNLVASADYAAVGNETDLNRAVADLTNALLEVAPSAVVAECRAIDFDGELLHFGDLSHEKRFERDATYSYEVIAWNQARARAAKAAIAADSTSGALAQSAALISRLAPAMRPVGDRWARGKPLTDQQVRTLSEISLALGALRPQPARGGALKATQLEASGGIEPAPYLLTMTINNLVPRLIRGDHVAPLAGALAKTAGELAALPTWALLPDYPEEALRSLATTLEEIRAGAAEDRSSNGQLRKALRRSGSPTLKQASAVARARADGRFEAQLQKCVAELRHAGLSAEALSRPGDPASPFWPGHRVLIAVDLDRVDEWLSTEEALFTRACRSIDSASEVVAAPRRRGKIVASRAIKLISQWWPAADEARVWKTEGVALLDETLGDTVRQAAQAIRQLSAIGGASRDGMLSIDDEIREMDEVGDRLEDAMNQLAAAQQPQSDQVLDEIKDSLLLASQRVADELDARRAGQPVALSLAGELKAAVLGVPTDLYGEWLALELLAAEWDGDPDDACDFLAALQQRDRLGSASHTLKWPNPSSKIYRDSAR